MVTLERCDPFGTEIVIEQSRQQMAENKPESPLYILDQIIYNKINA